MSKTTLRKKLFEICESLYKTGLNDGKNNIKYFPPPVKHRVDQILALLIQTMGEVIEEADKIPTLPTRFFIESMRTKNKLRASQRARLKDIIGGEK